MQVSHLLGSIGGLAVLGGSLYVTIVYLAPPSVPLVAHTSQIADVGDRDTHEPTELSHLQNEIRVLRQQMEKSSNPVAKPGNGDARELAALKQDVLNLRAELASLRRQVEVSDRTVSDGPASVIDRETAAQQQEQRDFERKQAMEASFQKETTDTNWSIATIDLINQVLMRDELKQTQVVDMTCRSTLCRLEIVHPDQEAAGNFESTLPLQVGQALPEISYHHQTLNDGGVSTVLYMARTGYSLPEVN